jgi:16S rRNA (adenine1518-N6/adenine1519-N6)-dimethyltransferase
MSIPDNAKIVSSPPYNISSKLTLLILNSHFSLAALLLQIEFAERLTAPSGSRNYGRLTVMFQTRARARMIEIVPRTAFYPQPKVDSSLLTITPTGELTPNNKELFEEMIRVVFTQRRRRLPTVLARFLKSKFPNQQDEIYTKIRIPEKRVFETTVKEFVTISDDMATFLTGSKRKDIDCMLE